MEALKQTLAEYPFFKGIDPRHLEFIAQVASEQSFEADELIFQEGDDAETFYLISRGTVMLGTFIPGKGLANIESLGKGEVLGWSGSLRPISGISARGPFNQLKSLSWMACNCANDLRRITSLASNYINDWP